jgi:hypothetical protein
LKPSQRPLSSTPRGYNRSAAHQKIPHRRFDIVSSPSLYAYAHDLLDETDTPVGISAEDHATINDLNLHRHIQRRSFQHHQSGASSHRAIATC